MLDFLNVNDWYPAKVHAMHFVSRVANPPMIDSTSKKLLGVTIDWIVVGACLMLMLYNPLNFLDASYLELTKVLPEFS
jgi:hypothetical protein